MAEQEGRKHSASLEEYNKFCKGLKEGDVLYNINKTNRWGEYLLVANITRIAIDNFHTYTILFLVLKRERKDFVFCNLKIRFNPEHAGNISYFKYIGHINFRLVPVFDDINVNMGLVTVYSNTDLRRYSKGLKIRKPVNRKYSKGGDFVIDKT